MRKTNFFDLNLWDLEDRIKMEDFNADNAKLDDALRELSRGVKHIMHSSSTNGTESRTGCPLWGYDVPTRWEEYSVVLVLGNLRPVNSGDNVFVQLFRRAPDAYTFDPAGSFTFPSGGFFYLLTPMRDADQPIRGLFGCSGMMKGFVGTMPFRDVTYIDSGGKTPGGDYGSAKHYTDFVHILGVR